MWVSTGKAGTPNAWDMTTLAVLCPTPGSSSSSAKVFGTDPPCFSTRSFDRPEIAFAFCGESPHGRMMLWMSATGTRAIFAGVSARANSSGVTSFTFRSVHWAESTTETRRVKASL